MVTETDLAYIAGLFDGEAYIGIKKSPPYHHLTGRVNPGYHAQLSIKMVDESAIRFVAETLGGWYYREKKYHGSLSKRPLFTYQATQAAAEHILRAILPYLRVKRLNAENVLALRDLQANRMRYKTKITGTRLFPNKYGTPRMVENKALSDEYVAECDRRWALAKQLNHGE